MSVNSFQLIGRLCSDPEVKTTPAGAKVVKVRMAFDFGNKKPGSDEYASDFFNVEAWGKTADQFEKWGKKGRLAAVTVVLKNREWDDQNGNKRYATDLKAFGVRFLDKNGDANESSSPATSTDEEGDPWADE